jgi:uncharacterized membrane protein YbhN (UPF0104 family)
MRVHLTLRHALSAGITLAALIVLCASPGLLGDRIRTAVSGVAAAPPGPLWGAAACFVLTNVCAALAWRVALRACGTPLTAVDAAARYCVGSGVNAVAPLHAGSAARLALFARLTDGGVWTVGGAAAAVGAIRGLWLVALVASGSAMGALPAWPLFGLGGAAIGAAALALLARRFSWPRRAAHVLDAFRELRRSPRDLATVAGWSLAGVGAKLGAAAAVAGALGVAQPLHAAVVIVAAVEVAAIMPLTPGNVGVASAAVALALSARGIDSHLGLSVGIAFGAVEWLTGLGVGVAGGLALSRHRFSPRLVLAASAAGAWAVAMAFGATVLVPVF